jgi:3-dehydroquinate synthase
MTPILIKAGQEEYEAFVGSRLLERAGELIAQKLNGTGCSIVSDENVAAHYAEKVNRSLTDNGFRPTLITIPPGEKSKSLTEAERICQRMSEAGLDRKSFVVALGGGVVGDLAGFVAAIYHRGIPWVQMPTTLLAQVDSSIGGKTAVNTKNGKNLIGAWHHPTLIISDTDTIETQPARERRQGFAEILKHAVIRDAEMFEMLQNVEQQDLASLIRRNISIKASFVAADERDEKGERALLNFGHTVGHAIEWAGGLHDLLHGEAISLGMVAACEISVRKAGLAEQERDRIVKSLHSFGLPIHLPPDFARDKIFEAIRFDKKFRNQAVHFVVTPAIGSARIATDVTMDDIAAAIKAL